MSYAKIIMYIYRPPKKKKNKFSLFLKEKEEMKNERKKETVVHIYLFWLFLFLSKHTIRRKRRYKRGVDRISDRRNFVVYSVVSFRRSFVFFFVFVFFCYFVILQLLLLFLVPTLFLTLWLVRFPLNGYIHQTSFYYNTHSVIIYTHTHTHIYTVDIQYQQQHLEWTRQEEAPARGGVCVERQGKWSELFHHKCQTLKSKQRALQSLLLLWRTMIAQTGCVYIHTSLYTHTLGVYTSYTYTRLVVLLGEICVCKTDIFTARTCFVVFLANKPRD